MNDIYGIINGDSDFILDELIKKGVRYDLILTDPPYNINKDFGNTSDCLTIDEFRKITQLRVQKLKKLLTPTGSIIWFGIHNYICYVQIAMYDAGLFYRRMNIWHYENGFSRSKKNLLHTMNHFYGFQTIVKYGHIMSMRFVFHTKAQIV